MLAPEDREFGRQATNDVLGTTLHTCELICRDNPSPASNLVLAEYRLVTGGQAKKLEKIEIVLGDDGSSDLEGSRKYCDVAEGTEVPCALLTVERKVGRSAMRNILFAQARGSFLLQLDAHFETESLSYLSDWLAIARANMTDVAYGGYVTRELLPLQDRFVARWNRCPSLKKRRSDPPWYSFTGNLLVRRSVMERIAYDEGFQRHFIYSSKRHRHT